MESQRMAYEASDNISFDEPTSVLRFIRRDGKMILQQMIAVKQFTTRHTHQVGQTNEWRDVPIEDSP
jgi:hypothetical protein